MADPVGTREITLTRRYDAPREVLFALWTQAEHLSRWWGPDGFSAPRVQSDPRPGGELTIVMAGPDGFEQTMEARYLVVEPPEHLEVASVVPGPDGRPVLESSHAVTFAEADGGTEVTVVARAAVFIPAALRALEGMRAGWRQSLQCLDDALTGADERQLVLAHHYAAPPEAVFPRWVRPEDLERWWGPDGFTLTTHEHDARPGGTWRFTMHGPDGTEHPNVIRYDEVVPNERLVYTHGGAGDDPSFQGVVTFDEMAGTTVVSMRLVFASPAQRDLVDETYHARDGGAQTLARLDALLPAGS